MKTILRNFFFVLRRFKMATVLNVLGLSVAYVAFMLIVMQVDYDKTFDCHYPHANAISRMDLQHPGSSQAIIARPYARMFIESSPHIQSGCILGSWEYDLFFYVEKDGQRVPYKEQARSASSGLIDVFQFDMVEGDKKALAEPKSVVIPESMAKKFFGNESALNQQLYSRNGKKTNDSWTIKGVYRDFPLNVSLSNVLYVKIPDEENYDSWSNWNYYAFVRLDSPEQAATVKANFEKNLSQSSFGPNLEWLSESKISLISLPELHFVKGVDFDNFPKASQQTLFVLFTIAFVILAIAGINFTNFSTALTPMRIKSINTQKILGSPVYVLRGCLLLEAVCISLFSYLLSIYFLELVKVSPIASFIDADLSWNGQWPIIIGTGIVSVIVGLLAGIYPSYYVTSFPPAFALKGSFGLSPAGRKMRSILVGIQYVSAFALIIGSLFMYLQNRYMQNAPMGYDKDEIITVRLNRQINDNLEAFSNQLKSFSGVEDVAYSEFLLSSQDRYMGWGRDYRGKTINFQCLPVSFSFLKTMGIEIKEGRDFRSEDNLKETGCYIFNEKARALYDLELNEKVNGSEIIGFIPDIKFASFRQEVTPMAFYLWGKYRWGQPYIYYNMAYVKFKAGSDLRAGMEYVRESLKKYDSEYPFDVRFYDEILQMTYAKELKMGSLITLFSLVAIFISIVGVFGLVVFESEYKRKEIAIRKVLGSTTGQILYMFNRNYFWILLVSFLMGAPIAWFGVQRWLENFAYRTPMYFWILLLAFALVGLITVVTVTFQNWHVANENPVKNIKTE